MILKTIFNYNNIVQTKRNVTRQMLINKLLNKEINVKTFIKQAATEKVMLEKKIFKFKFGGILKSIVLKILPKDLLIKLLINQLYRK